MTRPRFVLSDWSAYVRVNEKFAHAVLAEIGPVPAVVWVQDYHFALLPRLLRDARPDLLVAQFWHIPWPHPEAFHLCPWRTDLLRGVLANDPLGFHLRSYRDNFLATVDREGAGRMDRERSAVSHRAGAETVVRPFPMSTDFGTLARQAESAAVRDEAARVQRTYGLQGRRICLGLDRVEYTKGIPERLRAVDRLFSKYPRYRRHLVFLQAGPESRGRILRYQALNAEIDALVDDINHRHGTTDWTPILLLMTADERARRMRALRDTVAENNIYRWAGQVLHTLTTLPHKAKRDIPLEPASTTRTPFAVTTPALIASSVAK